MKKFTYASGAIVLASLLLFSCKKEIQSHNTESVISSPQTIASTECKPAVLGAYSGTWTTLAQKWYENGKVKYLKARHGSTLATFIDPILEFLFDLNWGEVTYAGNQVYLKDVADNRMQMRVTLDDAGRPVASYYNYKPYSYGNEYTHDTTYYYYDGDRLDYFISIYETVPYGTIHLYQYRKYQLSYDAFGNLTQAEFPGHSKFTVQYDYTRPVSGVISNFNMTSSVKILEYLELIKLPMHHAVTETTVEIASSQPGMYWTLSSAQYKDYVITDGLVRSYVFDGFPGKIIFYNGWECGNGSLQNAASKLRGGIASLKQFQELYFTPLPNERK